ncbi:hypothetical protein H920_18930 [Fukomys damarensis]|uniref:Uncharacterized protein n=1 Tax=Fukomys damarensis TaxID=885580 RepID=A0A091CLH1_FUKDA|nr:hypothetical protein H920_18930 [Fukomys damarensis]
MAVVPKPVGLLGSAASTTPAARGGGGDARVAFVWGLKELGPLALGVTPSPQCKADCGQRAPEVGQDWGGPSVKSMLTTRKALGCVPDPPEGERSE